MRASETAIKIVASITGMADVEALKKSLGGLQGAAKSAQDGLRKVVATDAFKAAAIGAGAVVAGLALATKTAIDFEESMADVRKVVDGLESPEAFKAMEQEIIGLSRQMPIAAKGFADIYAAAGQAGIAQEELKDFAVQVAQVAIAFDMTAEQAGTSMAKLRTSLGLSQQEVTGLADAMNHLSNNMASTASQLVDFTLRAGTSGKQAGLTAEQTAAFGSAMIAAGAEADVAATSFNNMIRALSRGDSMTSRQTDALQRLGYAVVDAADKEKQLTRAAERESRRRLDIARRETDQLSKEIDRRYRDQLTFITDQEDDRFDAISKGINQRQSNVVKGLQREQDARIKAIRDAENLSDPEKDRRIYAIQDEYDQRLQRIRDGFDRELTLQRRAQRDRLTAIQDQLNDRKELEVNAAQARFQEQERLEKENLEKAKARAKEFAQEVSKEAARTLAQNLQTNAIATITEVFDRIRSLPAAERISVISDLFGDEARALAPLISNTELLAKSLNLVGDAAEYSGSTLSEYENRLDTTATKLQLARNELDATAISIGQEVLPVFAKLVEVLSPALRAFTQLPAPLQTALVAFAGISSALILILPALSGLVTIVGTLGPAFAAIGTVIGAVGTALSGLGPIILGIFTGPVGWIALLVAAGVAIYAFRDQIGAALKAISDFFVDAFKFIGDLLKQAAQAYLDFYVKPVLRLARSAFDGIVNIFGRIAEAVRGPFNAASNVIKSIFRNILIFLVNSLNTWINRVNFAIRLANRLPFVNIPRVPNVSVPAFAQGGVVGGPTLAMVGEGGEREYIVPESKMARASANYLAGMRGRAVIPAFAEGGVVGPGGGGGAANTTVQITTGPVLQQDGQRYVTVGDLERALQDFGSQIFRNSRTYGGRRYQGAF